MRAWAIAARTLRAPSGGLVGIAQPLPAPLRRRVLELSRRPEWAEWRRRCDSMRQSEEHWKQRQLVFSARSTMEWARRPQQQVEDELTERRDRTRELQDGCGS